MNTGRCPEDKPVVRFQMDSDQIWEMLYLLCCKWVWYDHSKGVWPSVVQKYICYIYITPQWLQMFTPKVNLHVKWGANTSGILSSVSCGWVFYYQPKTDMRTWRDSTLYFEIHQHFIMRETPRPDFKWKPVNQQEEDRQSVIHTF